MKRFKLTICYDGTAYCGWQRQVDPTPTVQRAVEKALGQIVSQPVTVLGSSRTDTGVHALGQVAAVNLESDLETERLRRAINSRLPHDILIRTMEEVPAEFDVRTAIRKRYRYLIWAHPDRPVFYRHYIYHFYRELDLQRMQTACSQFIGTHDFESFKGQTDDRDNTVRTIFSCDIRRHPDVHNRPLVIFAVEGSGFLYHMVRTMVGTVLQIGTGHWSPERIAQILAARDRRQAGPCAPAVGLHLQWIRFPDATPPPQSAIDTPARQAAEQIQIRRAATSDQPEWLRMRRALWPDRDAAELQRELHAIAGVPEHSPVFVAVRPTGGLCGFLEANLRDVADGCESSPVAYIEGWYVDEDSRRLGIGRQLVRAAEQWAQGRGLKEIASDCVLNNAISERAHKALGYQETDRLIHFHKTLR